MPDKIRIAIIGVGRMGSKHLAALQANPNFEVVAVVDPNLVDEPAVPNITGYNKITKDMTDAVVIATPSRLHKEIGLYFLRLGIHVLMEKPMALKLDDCLTLVKAANKYQCATMVGQIERFNPAFIAAQEFLIKNNITLNHCKAERFNPASHIQDSGVILDLLVHDIDAILALSGGQVSSVEITDSQLGNYGYDSIDVRFKLNELVADIAATRGKHAETRLQGKQQKRLLICQWEQNSMSVDFLNRQVLINGKQVNVPQIDALQEEHNQFYRNITKQQNILNFTDVLKTMQAVFAIRDKTKRV